MPTVYQLLTRLQDVWISYVTQMLSNMPKAVASSSEIAWCT